MTTPTATKRPARKATAPAFSEGLSPEVLAAAIAQLATTAPELLAQLGLATAEVKPAPKVGKDRNGEQFRATLMRNKDGSVWMKGDMIGYKYDVNGKNRYMQFFPMADMDVSGWGETITVTLSK